MSFLKRTKNNYLFALIIVFAFVSACGKKETKEDSIAIVNDAVLSKKMLDSLLIDEMNSAKVKDEIINDWIENEMLFQESVKQGITKENEYNLLVEKSKKNIAVSLLLKKKLEEKSFEIKEEELKKYFETNKEDFLLNDNLYKINLAIFSNYDDALDFRKKSIDANWEIAIENSKGKINDGSVNGNYLFERDLQPVVLLRIINSLQQNEISIVFDYDKNKFAVVKLVNVFSKGSYAPYDYATDNIKKRITIIKQKEYIKEYIGELLSDYNLEIERYSE